MTPTQACPARTDPSATHGFAGWSRRTTNMSGWNLQLGPNMGEMNFWYIRINPIASNDGRRQMNQCHMRCTARRRSTTGSRRRAMPGSPTNRPVGFVPHSGQGVAQLPLTPVSRHRIAEAFAAITAARG